MEDVGGGAVALWQLGGLAALQGRAEPAAQLLGASEVFREYVGANIPPCDAVAYERAVTTTRAMLDPMAFEAAWRAGRGLGLHDAAELGLAGEIVSERIAESAATTPMTTADSGSNI
jgi:hypothetical protein